MQLSILQNTVQSNDRFWFYILSCSNLYKVKNLFLRGGEWINDVHLLAVAVQIESRVIRY